MNTKFDPEPSQNWQRKLYDEAPLRQLDYRKDEDRRKGSEIETNRDLDKPLEQLVCDVHEETHDPKRTEIANLAGAQKRMVSMMARVAKSNDRVSFWMIILTVAIALMTAALLLFIYWLWQDAKDAKTAAEDATISVHSVATPPASSPAPLPVIATTPIAPIPSATPTPQTTPSPQTPTQR